MTDLDFREYSNIDGKNSRIVEVFKMVVCSKNHLGCFNFGPILVVLEAEIAFCLVELAIFLFVCNFKKKMN